MKRTPVVLGSMLSVCLFAASVQGQERPPGALISLINCSLNDGTSMADAVQWARAAPRDETAPNAIFFRQAFYAGSYRASSDFTMAAYFPSYGEMVGRTGARLALPDNRVRPNTRATDLFTCDPSTFRLNQSRTVNPGNDGFSGDATLMTTRFCELNENSTVDDAYAFVQGVARNYQAGGDNSLMQLYTRELGPVGETVIGGRSGLAIATVPATPAAFASRMDLRREGLNALEGLTLPMTCDYPAMWVTYAVHRTGGN
jgi:hypothetical protein